MTDDLLYASLLFANPDAVIHPDLRAAYRGHVVVPGGEVVACYSVEAAVEILVERDGMEPDDAADFLDYNYVGCQGPHHPLWLYECEPVAPGEAASSKETDGDDDAPVRVYSRRIHDCLRRTP